MRPLLQFFGFCFIVFFVVGEFQGWYVGYAPQTPMFLYKQDKTVNVKHDVELDSSLAFNLDGKVRDGSVRIEAYFEVPASFQQGSQGKAPRLVFEEEFTAGQFIDLDETLKNGRGRYTLRIVYRDAVGLFNLKIPEGGTL